MHARLEAGKISGRQRENYLAASGENSTCAPSQVAATMELDRTRCVSGSDRKLTGSAGLGTSPTPRGISDVTLGLFL